MTEPLVGHNKRLEEIIQEWCDSPEAQGEASNFYREIVESRAPATEIPAETRTGVRGEVVEGDVAP